MATRYWLNTTGDGDDTNPADYDQPPQNGDDLVFDPSQPGYNGQSSGDGPNGGLNGYTFGTVNVMDGSFIGAEGSWTCGPLYLNNNSIGCVVCAAVNAGADGSGPCFNGSATNSGSVFAGSSQNNGDVFDYTSFYDSSQNNGNTGNSTVYTNSTQDWGHDGDQVSYDEDSTAYTAIINGGSGTATFIGSSNLEGISAGTINWNSAAWQEENYLNDEMGQVTIGTLNVFQPMGINLNNANGSSAIGAVVLASAAASLAAIELSNGATVGPITVDTTNLTSGNIKDGVTILGQTGTLLGGTAGAGYISGGNAGY